MIYLDPRLHSRPDDNVLFSPDGGGESRYRAFADTRSLDEAAANRQAAVKAAQGRMPHVAVAGLRQASGSAGMLASIARIAERPDSRLLTGALLSPTPGAMLSHSRATTHRRSTLRQRASNRPEKWGPDRVRILRSRYRMARKTRKLADRILSPVGSESLGLRCQCDGPTPERVRLHPDREAHRQLALAASGLERQVRVSDDLIREGDRHWHSRPEKGPPRPGIEFHLAASVRRRHGKGRQGATGGRGRLRPGART